MLSHFSNVQLFVTPWTVAHQASLPMEFSRQEYWIELLFSPPGDLPDSGIKPVPPESPTLAGRFFTNCTTWEARVVKFVKQQWITKTKRKWGTLVWSQGSRKTEAQLEMEGGMKNQWQTWRVTHHKEDSDSAKWGPLALATLGVPSRKRREGRVSDSATDGLRVGSYSGVGITWQGTPISYEQSQGLGDQGLPHTCSTTDPHPSPMWWAIWQPHFLS